MQSEVLEWEREHPPLTQAWEGQVERIWFEDDAALYNLETPTCPMSDEFFISYMARPAWPGFAPMQGSTSMGAARCGHHRGQELPGQRCRCAQAWDQQVMCFIEDTGWPCCNIDGNTGASQPSLALGVMQVPSSPLSPGQSSVHEGTGSVARPATTIGLGRFSMSGRLQSCCPHASVTETSSSRHTKSARLSALVAWQPPLGSAAALPLTPSAFRFSSHAALSWSLQCMLNLHGGVHCCPGSHP